MCPIILKSQSTCSCFGISARTSNVNSDMVGIGSNTNMGFTILEMVVSLAIMSILAAVIVTGIVQAVNGFIFVTGTQAVVENAELAMLRLTKELAVTQKSTITGNAASLTFSSLHTGANATYTALLSNSQLILRDNNNNNYVLANNISALSFAYYDSYNGTPNTTWAATRRIVHISITVSGPNNALLIFSTSIAPRN
jgi:prepilin-type N-terminal cleavage/methylation domain-containing protein